MNNVNNRSTQRHTADTYTTGGQLVRLVLDPDTGEILGAQAITTPNAWVYRRPFVVPDDVD